MEYIETAVKNAFGMTFRVHTPNLFKEIWDCSGMRIYAYYFLLASKITKKGLPSKNMINLQCSNFVKEN